MRCRHAFVTAMTFFSRKKTTSASKEMLSTYSVVGPSDCILRINSSVRCCSESYKAVNEEAKKMKANYRKST